ncbi:RNA polymerase sigma factor [Mucilaginibacter celer]|uniref:Sigma-70 family RNA polymerase sigma factor n=1 Tax=Mucilaginibacter celer TaxID=2305508 RepID=A0A494VR56_9SPHI|nr:RNA polymerase sigma factor [Mucilaginibacter celer]AYL96939.1 sigma-70 family RNA polymerase sigma factor [Mucilaginibacter celer]
MKKNNTLSSHGGASQHEAFIPQNWQYHYHSLFSFARKLITDTDIIKDLIQETFLIALETQSKFMGRCSEKTWLIAILKRRIYDEYRRQAKEKRHLGHAIDIFEPDNLFDSYKDSALIEQIKYDSGCDDADLANDLIKDGLKSIPSKTKDILIKIYYDNRSVSSICEELKITPSNCYVICYRGKELLRNFLIQRLFTD